ADPARVIFELTETALMDDIDAGERFTRGLNALGCAVALDDFGTGFGSFTYLQRLPVRYLKIDIEFVRDLTTKAASRHLVTAIVNLAKGFEQETIAEGVEDAQTLELLRDFGVDYAQGFHLGRPTALGDVPPA
ncbi:MAG TPA: EAL domain-containing protein, partial [Solirubrobacteraceae bacterium]|nr:EAL domain-containing protein [Solirubrobacteraceae bacterium]